MEGNKDDFLIENNLKIEDGNYIIQMIKEEYFSYFNNHQSTTLSSKS
jgi:hypothetical protein